MKRAIVIAKKDASHGWERDTELYVYIGRGSIHGNPYVLGRDGTREVVIAKHKAGFVEEMQEGGDHFVAMQRLKRKRQVILVCPGNCKPRACHGDTMAAWLNI